MRSPGLNTISSQHNDVSPRGTSAKPIHNARKGGQAMHDAQQGHVELQKRQHVEGSRMAENRTDSDSKVTAMITRSWPRCTCYIEA